MEIIDQIDTSIENHIAAAALLIESRGAFSQERLDEEILDVFCAAFCFQAATENAEEADELLRVAESKASVVNNQGQTYQVAALMALGMKEDEIMALESEPCGMVM